MDSEASTDSSRGIASDDQVVGTGQGSGEEHIRFEKSRPTRLDEAEDAGQADVFGVSDEGEDEEGGLDGVPLI